MHTLKEILNPNQSLLLIAIFWLCALSAITQENHSEQEAEHSEHGEDFKKHRLALVFGNTHIPAGTAEQGRQGTLIAASWGLDYEFWFNRKWAIGLHSDIELLSYFIENDNHQGLEREYPFVSTLVVVYNPWKTLSLYAGPGVELETHENFYVTRVGFEYGIELPGHWEFSPGMSYDNKEGDFDAWTFGMAISKRF